MNKSTRIYFDYAATTPVDPLVLTSMQPYFDQLFGNSSSIHFWGQEAESALEDSRESVAKLINCRPNEVIFTSCGTESDNLALRGCAISARNRTNKKHILISSVEHHAVSQTALQLQRLFGFEVDFIPVDSTGMVDPHDVIARIRPDTCLVSVIHANNEIGTINPISEIGQICQERDVLLHTDAIQSAAHLPVDVEALHVDLLSMGAHKFYGPKGVGALYIRQETPIEPIQTGGGQEFNLRAGTHNIPYIVGLAKAFEIAQQSLQSRAQKVIPMRDHIIGTVLEAIPAAHLTGHPTQRLPNHASFIFENVDGNTLLMMLDVAGFACSSGSACKTGNPEPSEILLAMGIKPQNALGSLRITLGQSTTTADVQAFLDILPSVVEKNRQLNMNH